MKRMMLLLLLCSSIHVFAQRVNFSGTWQIDKDKTDFAGARAAEWIVPKTIKVDQETDKFILTRISVDKQGQELSPIVETLAFNGTPYLRTSANAKVTTSISWLNNQSFTLSRKGEMTVFETWVLEDNGKTLVVDRVVEQSHDGKYTIKCYYDKVD